MNKKRLECTIIILEEMAYQGFRKFQAVQSAVRPVLSLSKEEAHARVRSLYRSCIRQTPYICMFMLVKFDKEF